MHYTVKDLAKLFDVSIRTLRFYDQIGLLKPAFYGLNGYRYYTEEERFILQQILFLRELGIKLNDIHVMLNKDNLYKLDLLTLHRDALLQKIKKCEFLLGDIDKTIQQLKTQGSGVSEKIFLDFHFSELPRYDAIAIQEMGMFGEKLIGRRNERLGNWNEKDWNHVIFERNKLCIQMRDCLYQMYKPSHPIMQALINQWVHLTLKPFYEPSQEEFLAIYKLNCTQPDYRKSFDFYDSDLASFIYAAAHVYALKNVI